MGHTPSARATDYRLSDLFHLLPPKAISALSREAGKTGSAFHLSTAQMVQVNIFKGQGQLSKYCGGCSGRIWVADEVSYIRRFNPLQVPAAELPMPKANR
jgi:hypothetical protein